jgi:NADH-quinone oxidoreductase subunit J
MHLAILTTTLVPAILFYLFAGIAGASALGVVLARDIVRNAVFLLFTLVGVAGLYFLLDSEFLAAVQLVVYVGGTLILLIFGIMLTSRAPTSRFEPRRGEVIVAIVAGIFILAALVAAIRNGHFRPNTSEAQKPYPVAALGQALLGDYLVPFELASVVLLVVMIGAAYLARARRRDDQHAPRGAASRTQLSTHVNPEP